MAGKDLTWEKLKKYIEQTSQQRNLDIMICFVVFCIQDEKAPPRWIRLKNNFMKEHLFHITYLVRKIVKYSTVPPLEVNDEEALAKKITEMIKEKIVEMPDSKDNKKRLCKWVINCFSIRYTSEKMYRRITYYLGNNNG